MRFLLNMAVDFRVAEWLRNGGHDALHLREKESNVVAISAAS
jgi:predicted nuclease of predicted toxin-antitoxin system